jgi:hypothetical protein
MSNDENALVAGSKPAARTIFFPDGISLQRRIKGFISPGVE